MSSHHIAIATEMKIDDHLLAIWGDGCAELYAAVSEVAHFVDNLEKALYSEERQGLMAYDVSEPLGPYLRSRVELGQKELLDDSTRHEVGRLAFGLFLSEPARSVITDLTDYTPPDPLVDAWEELYSAILAFRELPKGNDDAFAASYDAVRAARFALTAIIAKEIK